MSDRPYGGKCIANLQISFYRLPRFNADRMCRKGISVSWQIFNLKLERKEKKTREPRMCLARRQSFLCTGFCSREGLLKC